MKKLAVLAAVMAVSGCASTTTEYYQAVQKAAEANALASQAKFEALSKIAESGDGQAASAAVMALALTQTPTIQPVPQQSQALQWASILAAPISNLGMMWLQTDSTKAMAEYNRDVSLARISADTTTQQALYGAFIDQSALTADVALGGFNAMGNVDYTPFIDGMVDLGTAGINGAVDLGTAGFDANTAIATVGLNSTTQLGVTGMDNLTSLGAAGYESLVGLGTAGLDTATTLGIAGMDGISGVATDGFANMLNIDSNNNSLFSTIWTSYQTSLQNLLDSVPTCSATVNADGSTSTSCN